MSVRSGMTGDVVKVVLLPGDGVGPQVIAEAERVLRAVSGYTPSLSFDITSHPFGGTAIDATGEPLPESTLQACLSADAVLAGPVGGKSWYQSRITAQDGILALRQKTGVYASIRRIYFPSPALFVKSSLKAEIAVGVDITVVRELLGGVYYGSRREPDWSNDNPSAVDTSEYNVEQVTRIARFAGTLAMKSSPPLPVHSIDKANVLSTSRLWRAVVSQVFASEFPLVPLQFVLVDAAAMTLASRPRQLNGILLCDNLFGDILSDEIASIPGSIGIIPSAALSCLPDGQNRPFGIYEPVHGPSPDLVAKAIANPIGAILSVALLFRYTLGMEPVAQAIEQAVSKALDVKLSGGMEAWTRDLGGSFTTSEVGDVVIEALRPLLQELQS